ncbi:MAG: nickel ABC transporter permease [Methanohalobium sp.]|uniref:nickel ABC transporter permease n=1 Tax=Methanohalobium sp. TaxID=2837493 RepID=UPI00397A32D9
MLNYVIRRLLFLIPVLLVISVISFSIIYIIPGDTAEILLTSPSGGSDQKAVEEFRKEMGLDEPLYIQYFNWLGNVLHGNLGYSYMTDRPVFETIFDKFTSTLRLSVVSLIISLLIAVPGGILAALKHDTWVDDLSRFTSLIGISMPNFWLGFLLIIVFSITFDWLPVGGYGDGGLQYMLLPAIALGTSSAAVIMRLMRSSMIEIMEQDYVRAARARGLSELSVVGKHALKNALIPVVTMIGLNFGYLLNGSVVVETVFNWPGIGTLVVDSIENRDYPMVQGSLLFIALLFVTVNFMVDLSYAYLNPKIRYEKDN